MSKKSNELTASEIKARAKLEQAVLDGLTAQAAMGSALDELYNKKLYRDHGRSFSRYADEKWSLHIQTILYHIKFAKDFQVPKANGTKTTKTN